MDLFAEPVGLCANQPEQASASRRRQIQGFTAAIASNVVSISDESVAVSAYGQPAIWPPDPIVSPSRSMPVFRKGSAELVSGIVDNRIDTPGSVIDRFCRVPPKGAGRFCGFQVQQDTLDLTIGRVQMNHTM